MVLRVFVKHIHIFIRKMRQKRLNDRPGLLGRERGALRPEPTESRGRRRVVPLALRAHAVPDPARPLTARVTLHTPYKAF